MLNQNSDRKSQNYSSNLKSKDVKARAYQFSLDVIKFINELPNKRAFWSIGDQLLRAVTSIGANMVEGRASSSRREFIKFYEIALKSANESVYWLSLLKDSYKDLGIPCQKLLLEAHEICSMLGSSILTLKGKRSL